MVSRQLVGAVRRACPLLLLAAVLPIALVLLTGSSGARQYTATSSVYVNANTSQDPQELNKSAVYVHRQMGSFAALASTPTVLDPVIDKLGLATSARQLAGRVGVAFEQDGFMISLSATSSSAQGAQRLADAVSTSLATVVEEVSPPRTDGTSSVRARSMGSAVDEILSSRPWTTAITAGALGLLAAITFTLFRFARNDKIGSLDEITEITSAPLVAEPRLRGRHAATTDHEMERLSVTVRGKHHSAGGRVILMADTSAGRRAVDTASWVADQLVASGRTCLVVCAVRTVASTSTQIKPAGNHHMVMTTSEGVSHLVDEHRATHDVVLVARAHGVHNAARSVAFDGATIVLTVRATTVGTLIGVIKALEAEHIPILGIVAWTARRPSLRSPLSARFHPISRSPRTATR